MQDVANDGHYYARRLELSLNNLSQDQLVSIKNKETILSYVKFSDAEGLSIPRQVRQIAPVRQAPTITAPNIRKICWDSLPICNR